MTRRRGALLALLLAVLPGFAAAADWPGYQVILWHDHGPAALAGARRYGVTAGMMLAERDAFDPATLRARAAPFTAAGLGFYVENIATDFYAAYHRWTQDHPVTWQFDLVRARHREDPADPTVWDRRPSLSDPAMREAIAARLAAHVRTLAPLHPLFYSLGDETGIADLSAAWDFDQGPPALAALRRWLRAQYGTLAALNAEWGSAFARWDDVVPTGTDEAIARADGNFAAWNDFKAFMDASFADALRAGTAAVHAADPAALAGIEGAQIPGWGGYDYTRLADVVDVMEIYDYADNIDIVAGLNPGLVLLTSTGRDDAAARHDIWHAALLGARGLILWDPHALVVGADGATGPHGAALAATLDALRGPAGARLIAARPDPGPVGILYSPASERIAWLSDRQAEAARGLPDWTTRDAAAELADNAPRRARHAAVVALTQRGIAPRWLTPQRLAAGGLAEAGLRVVVLPQSCVLSAQEIAALRAFRAAGGLVLADTPPGAFDGHGRRRPAVPDGIARVLAPFDTATLAGALDAAGIAPRYRLLHPDGSPVSDVEMRARRQGATVVLGLLRDVPHATASATPETVELVLNAAQSVQDLLAPGPARTARRLTLQLDAAMPALLALAAP